jgi:hypothetical protein
MRPQPHACRALHVPGEIIDEDAVMGHVSKRCQHPLERPDVPLRLPHIEGKKPSVEDLDERVGGLDLFLPFPRLIGEQYEAMPTQRPEQLRHAWHSFPEGAPHPGT